MSEDRHPPLDPRHERDLTDTITALRDSTDRMRALEEHAKRAAERAELHRASSEAAALALHRLLERIPGRAYTTPDGTTYRATITSDRTPDGELIVTRGVTITTPGRGQAAGRALADYVTGLTTLDDALARLERGPRPAPGPHLRPQPTWPAGDAPDVITDISGGFLDGTNHPHSPPPGYNAAAPDHAGTWRWLKTPESGKA